MQELETFWRVSLAVMCGGVFWWLKWSGVKHDDEGTGETSGTWDDHTGVIICSGSVNRGAAGCQIHAVTIRGKDGKEAGHDGQIVNLHDYRVRRDVREWSHRTGIYVRSDEVGR